MYHAGPWPKVARPTWESTDSVADGRAPAVVARKEIPRKTKPRITAIITIVAWAFFHSGGLNAGVPFEMASVPVIALHPSANARIRRSRLMDSTGTWIGTTPVTSGGWPRAVRTTPTATRITTLTTKMYVGRAKTVPLSRMPRRFTVITRRIAATINGTVKGCRRGNADARLKTPLDTLTATVRT